VVEYDVPDREGDANDGLIALCATRDGSPEEAKRIATFLAEQLRDYDDRYVEMPAPLATPGQV
jgi:hypothetical protein